MYSAGQFQGNERSIYADEDGMKPNRTKTICNCSHGCFNGAHCIHRDVFRHAMREVKEQWQGAEMIKFPLLLNYPFPNMPRVYRRTLGIRRVGERLVGGSYE